VPRQYARAKLRFPRGKPLDGRAIFGDNLRRFRKQLGLSQEALAELAGLHWTYVGSVERGERNVSIDNICRLAWAVGVDVRDLLVATR
jgi:transcriptional regulator with XRE-family HTH domain